MRKCEIHLFFNRSLKNLLHLKSFGGSIIERPPWRREPKRRQDPSTPCLPEERGRGTPHSRSGNSANGPQPTATFAICANSSRQAARIVRHAPPPHPSTSTNAPRHAAHRPAINDQPVFAQPATRNEQRLQQPLCPLCPWWFKSSAPASPCPRPLRLQSFVPIVPFVVQSLSAHHPPCPLCVGL
jgi:hypothetical protein